MPIKFKAACAAPICDPSGPSEDLLPPQRLAGAPAAGVGPRVRRICSAPILMPPAPAPAALGSRADPPHIDPRLVVQRFTGPVLGAMHGLLRQLHEAVICPIEQEILRQPVKLSCGHHVSEEAFDKWTAVHGSAICPLDRQAVTKQRAQPLMHDIIEATDMWEELGKLGFWNAVEANDSSTVKRFLEPSDAQQAFGALTQRSALHMVAAKGWSSMVEVLCRGILQSEVINARDENGCTPLHLICMHDKPLATAALLAHDGCDINARGPGNATALHLAIEHGCMTQAHRLCEDPRIDIDAIRDDGMTALHLCAAQGNLPLLRLLLAMQGRPDAGDLGGSTPLHAACANGHSASAGALAEAGADVNCRDAQGRTPVMVAASHGFLAPISRLLNARSDVDLHGVDHDGNTALLLAARGQGPHAGIQPNHHDVVCALRCTGDLNVKNGAGDTALLVAAGHGQTDIVRLLVQTPGVELFVRGRDADTPLLRAVKNNHLGVVAILHGLNQDGTHGPTPQGERPVQLAKRLGHQAIVAHLNEADQATLFGLRWGLA